jgi:hypothetical protein
VRPASFEHAADPKVVAWLRVILFMTLQDEVRDLKAFLLPFSYLPIPLLNWMIWLFGSMPVGQSR